jgi:outer membrane protein assembly factor BamD (BamD/ComL family)
VTIAVRVITSLNLDIEVAAVCTRRTADVASQNRYETVLEEMDEFFLKHLPIK